MSTKYFGCRPPFLWSSRIPWSKIWLISINFLGMSKLKTRLKYFFPFCTLTYITLEHTLIMYKYTYPLESLSTSLNNETKYNRWWQFILSIHILRLALIGANTQNVTAHFPSKLDLCGQLNTTGFSCLMPPSCLPSFPYPKPLMFKDKHLSFYPHPISGRSLRFFKGIPACCLYLHYERIFDELSTYIE